MQFYENMNAPWEMILMHCEAFAAHGDDYLRVFIRHIGAIHKRRRQFFRIFDTPLPHWQFFSSIHRRFWPIIDPSPPTIDDVVYGRPLFLW